MRKITKKFCGDNPVLLSYFRESRRYSPLDIRIRRTTLHFIHATVSIPVYFQSFRLSHLRTWIEDNISITILHETPTLSRKNRSRNIYLYQI